MNEEAIVTLQKMKSYIATQEELDHINMAIEALKKDKCSSCKHYDKDYGETCLNPEGTCRVFEYDGYEEAEMSNYKKKDAIWSIDYDMHEDKCYDRPSCPECHAPVGKMIDGKYRCYSCHKICNVDQKMLDWFAEREGEKIEMRDCFACGGIGTSEDHLVKNDITLEWQTAWGVCKKCGARFIV